MPKAKFKRKGAVVPLFDNPPAKRLRSAYRGEDNSGEQADRPNNGRGLLDLPEEVVCHILARLDLRSVAALEQACRHTWAVIRNARFWRKVLSRRLKYEPELRMFLVSSGIKENQDFNNMEISRCKELFGLLKQRVAFAWENCHPASVSRTKDLPGKTAGNRVLCQLFSSGLYFVAMYGTRTKMRHVLEINNRGTGETVRTVEQLAGKPALFRIVDDLGLIFIAYLDHFKIDMVRLGRPAEEEPRVLDLVRPGEAETGNVCDIVVRENITIRDRLYERVVMVAINTDSLVNSPSHINHIGEIQFYSLSASGELGRDSNDVPCPLARVVFNPVPEPGGTFYNQCIQKEGLTDFRDNFGVVVVGGQGGSTVLGILDIAKERLIHKLLLRDKACDRVISLMIDQNNPEMVCVLLSTGFLHIIHLPEGKTVFLQHLHYDKQFKFEGQLQQALHRTDIMGHHRLGIKYRNLVAFYHIVIPNNDDDTSKDIKLRHVRTLRITQFKDGHETGLDDNPAGELRKQYNELQKRFEAFKKLQEGIQRKIDKGLRLGTVTQGNNTMSKQIENLTSKLDMAHGKAKEIEAVCISCIAFDNRYCHALTLNKDLVTFDLLGAAVGHEADVLPPDTAAGSGSTPSTSRQAAVAASRQTPHSVGRTRRC